MKRNNTVAGVFEPFPLTKALKSQDHEQMAPRCEQLRVSTWRTRTCDNTTAAMLLKSTQIIELNIIS